MFIKRTVCNDGTSLSIQASRGHYCIPRDEDAPYLTSKSASFSTLPANPSRRKPCPRAGLNFRTAVLWLTRAICTSTCRWKCSCLHRQPWRSR